MRSNLYVKKEAFALKIILIIMIISNSIGAISLWFTNRPRFWVATVPSLVIQITSLAILNEKRYQITALLLSISLIFTSITTTLISDLSKSYNNSLIPVIMAIIIIGVFSYKRSFTLSIILFGSYSVITFLIVSLHGQVSQVVIESIIAHTLIFVIITIIGYISTIMNKQRLKLNKDLQISNKRVLAGEKLKSSELIMPALSHELASPILNAKTTFEILANEVKSKENNFSNKTTYLVKTLENSLLRISEVLDRYRIKTIDYDNLKITSLNELIKFLLTKLQIIYNDVFTLHIKGSDKINITKSTMLIPVLYDILENSIIHGRGQEKENINIYIDWKKKNIDDCKKYNFENIENSYNKNESFILISIKDDGIGLSNKKIIKMNKPILKSLDGKSVSSLGLYLSKLRLEHSYNGKISILNSDKGVIVRILIPERNI